MLAVRVADDIVAITLAELAFGLQVAAFFPVDAEVLVDKNDAARCRLKARQHVECGRLVIRHNSLLGATSSSRTLFAMAATV